MLVLKYYPIFFTAYDDAQLLCLICLKREEDPSSQVVDNEEWCIHSCEL